MAREGVVGGGRGGRNATRSSDEARPRRMRTAKEPRPSSLIPLLLPQSSTNALKETWATWDTAGGEAGTSAVIRVSRGGTKRKKVHPQRPPTETKKRRRFTPLPFSHRPARGLPYLCGSNRKCSLHRSGHSWCVST